MQEDKVEDVKDNKGKKKEEKRAIMKRMKVSFFILWV
jgi:hypothetical protein